MIDELIALSCLLAHGDIFPIPKKLLKDWDMDLVINTLSTLYSDFFPHPVRREYLSDGSIHLHGIEAGYLTKRELLTFFGV